MLDRLDYFHSVSAKYLEESEKSHEDYIDYISMPGSPVDLLGVFLISRLYRIHVAVVLSNCVWHTNHDRDIKKALFVLIFRGEIFTETYQINHSDVYLQSLHDKTQTGLMPSHCPDVKISLLDTDKDPKLSMTPKVVIKKEIKPFKSAQQSVAAKLLTKAKKELRDDKTGKKQFITELIRSGRLGGNKMIGMKCSLCETTCRSTREYVQHMRQYHLEATFPCDICGKIYQSFNGRYKHMKIHTGHKVVCMICGCGFNFSTELKNHLPVHDAASKQYCDSCGKGFASKSSLCHHAQRHLNLQLPCADCDKIFGTHDGLQ